MYSYFFKRCISMVFILMILFINIFSCYCVVHADTQSSGGHFGSETDLSAFNKVYEGFDFSDTIAKHESFYFTDSIGNKHAVARVGSAWICLFGSRATFNGSQDDLLNYYLSYYAYTGYRSISNSFCALMASQLGSITKGGYTLVENALSSNIKNVADNITYNESDDSISLNNSAVDKLREEIKNYWYKEKGLLTGAVGSYHCSTKSYFLNNILKNGWFDYEEDYNEYFNYIKNTDYSFVFTDDNNSAYVTYLLNKSDISYFYLNHEFSDYYSLNFANSVGYNVGFTNITKRLNLRDFYSSITSRDYSDCDTSVFSSIKFYLDYYNSVYSFKQSYNSCFLKNDGSEYDVLSSKGTYYFVCDELPLIFKNEASMNSFIEGSDSFLASTINKTGEDITFSIDKMNENIGEKLDSLVDSINSGKGNMSADELQNAIDKGLEDLNKNTEDIKDNTSDILEVLKEQNQILLDILGVTKHIADSVDDIDENANFSSLMSLLSTVFLGIQNAILYGQNTMNSDNSTDAQAVIYDEDNIAVYASGGGTSLDYRGGIFGHFPFSVIYHLYDWLKLLQTEPKCPEFTYNYGFMIDRKDDTECQITFDLSQYDSWRDVISSFMKLSFTLAVAVGTYKKFKGGDLS